jgi:hypothetical protein
MIKNFSIIVFSILLCINIITPQTSKEEGSYQKYVDWAWKGKFDPYIEGIVGYGRWDHKKFTGEFNDIGTGEFKIGYGEFKQIKSSIVSIDERFLFGSFGSNEFGVNKIDASKVGTEYWRFGLGNRLGFGYNLGPFALVPYSQGTFVWTQLETEYPSLTPEDSSILNRYDGSFRFGHSLEAGAKFEFANFISIHAGLEGNVIFPRHLFMKWLGSYLIFSIVYNGVSVFSEDIVYSSPVLGPVMYFILKNAVAAAFYLGMKEKMNWPFNSETPLTSEAFKVGASIRF